ncbi:MAG: nuclease A inhibitor family protein [Myxococcaceae bacterium]
MPKISSAPSPKLFAETWATEFKEAVKRAAGKDGRLSISEAQKLAARPDADRVFADNALNYFKTTGKKTVSIDVLATEMKAYAQRAAETAAGPDGKMSLADGAKLPTDLVEDFFMLRGKPAPGTTPVTPPGPSVLPELKTKLEAAVKDLLMPSETDASFKFLSGQALNGAAITPSVVRAQLSAQHDALLPQVMYVDPSRVPLASRTQVEERDFNGFMDGLTNNVDPNDPASVARGQQFAQLKATLSSELTDLKVYRFGTIDISTFIVGRTKSGELAGLLTGVVET